MKKNILKPFLLIAALLIFINTVQAQSVNKITISVKDIEYDDPNFTALRETLKKNPKVKLVKPSYTAGVAILSFTYAGEASQLWEEIPKTSKRFFSLGELGDDAISINYLNPQKNAGNSTAVTNSTQTKTTNKKECFDCDYFPLCNYDVTKTYEGGHIYRGVRKSDNSIVYYNCENGVVTMKWVTSSTPQYSAVDYDPFTDIQTEIYYEGKPVYTTHTEIILKSNAPVGTVWEGTGGDYRIMEKGLSITVDGIKHNEVIAVGSPENKVFYFAKAKGFVKSINMYEYNPEGIIDADMVGIWVIVNKSNGALRPYWKFNADGTGIYAYDETFATGYDNSFKWRIQRNNVLYLYGNKSPSQMEIKKLLPGISLDGSTFKRPTANDIDTTAYTIVDSPAMFPGGKLAWTKYCEMNLNLSIPEDNGAPKGTYNVIIRFTVTKDGSRKDFVPLTNHGYGLEKEVIRILKVGRQAWIPAKKNGKSVDSIVEQNQVFKVPVF